MNEPTAFAATVLVGGHSRRMGREKATLVHPDGRTLLERQLALVRALQPSELLVSARAGQSLPPLSPDVRRVDDLGDQGPLAGIVHAFAATTAPRLLVVAVDLPFLDVATLRRLLEQPRGAVPTDGTRYEPLAAVYPRSWCAEARAALAAGELSLQRLLGRKSAMEHFAFVPIDNPSVFLNWNRPTELPP